MVLYWHVGPRYWLMYWHIGPTSDIGAWKAGLKNPKAKTPMRDDFAAHAAWEMTRRT